MRRTLPYGDLPDQVVDLTEPAGPVRGVAVLVHGGYWRARFTRELMEPLAADLARRGWVVANVEYRRVGTGGGWPQTLDDVRAALDRLARLRRERGWPGRLVSVGHSVGGQLVLLAAGPVDAVVALAPVTDLVRTRAERLGEDAVRELLPEPPEERPEPYAEGSPIARLPVGRPLLVVQGDADTRVPPEHTADYVTRARAAGDLVDELLLPGVDHLALIDPGQPHWPAVVDWMAHPPAVG